MLDDTEQLTGGHWENRGGVRHWVQDEPPATTWADTSKVLADAANSPRKRTQALGTKISGLLDQLVKQLRADEKQAKARAAALEADQERRERIAELEAEIRKLKGQKPKAKAASAKPVAGEPKEMCEQCSRWFVSIQALRMHQRRTHQGFDPKAVHDEREAS